MEAGVYQCVYDSAGVAGGAGDERQGRSDRDGHCGVCSGVGGVCAGRPSVLSSWGAVSGGWVSGLVSLKRSRVLVCNGSRL